MDEGFRGINNLQVIEKVLLDMVIVHKVSY